MTIGVLIVDDIKSARKIVQTLLAKLGISKLHQATSGSEALEQLKTQEIDLIISDLNLSDMSGVELLATVRADNSMRDLYFLLMTSDMSKDALHTLKTFTAVDYLLKPFSSATLRAKLETLLGTSLDSLK